MFFFNSLEGQVGEESDGKEDGGESTADVRYESEDGALHFVSNPISRDVLYK